MSQCKVGIFNNVCRISVMVTLNCIYTIVSELWRKNVIYTVYYESSWKYKTRLLQTFVLITTKSAEWKPHNVLFI